MLFALERGPSPFTIIAFGWYDGLTSGLVVDGVESAKRMTLALRDSLARKVFLEKD